MKYIICNRKWRATCWLLGLNLGCQVWCQEHNRHTKRPKSVGFVRYHSYIPGTRLHHSTLKKKTCSISCMFNDLCALTWQPRPGLLRVRFPIGTAWSTASQSSGSASMASPALLLSPLHLISPRTGALFPCF